MENPKNQMKFCSKMLKIFKNSWIFAIN